MLPAFAAVLLNQLAQRLSVLTAGNADRILLLSAAPEVLLNDRCDAKVDVYSFGVTLHEVLTGEPPRRGQLRHIL